MNKYTLLPPTAYSELVLGRGVILQSFDPETGNFDPEDILSYADNISFHAQPHFTDMGKKSKNCPENTLRLTRLDGFTAELRGTLYSVSLKLINRLFPSSEPHGSESFVTAPGAQIDPAPSDLWFLADYSCVANENSGFFAVKLKNALSEGGIDFSAAESGKGSFKFVFSAKRDILQPNLPAFEIYLKKSAKDEKE